MLIKPTRVALSTLFTIAAIAAQAASFDCTRARLAREEAICADTALGKLDQDIADAYSQLLNRSPAQLKNAIRRSQRIWLLARNDETGTVLRENMRVRLRALQHPWITLNGLTFLRIDDDDSIPMYLMADMPGATVYNRWVDGKLRQIADESTASSTEQGCSVAPCITHNFAISFASKDVLSIIESISEDAGGVHPFSTTKQHNWWLGRGRTLAAADIFTDPRYQSVITDAVDAQAAEQQLAQHGHDLYPYALDPDNWRLLAEGLSVVITDDVLLSHASPSVEFLVPWMNFKGIVDQQLIAQLAKYPTSRHPQRPWFRKDE